MDWPWGHAQCEASISLDRKLIVAAVAEPKYEANIGKHDVVCHLNTKDGKDRHTVNLTIDPVVTFENGKATKAALALEQRDRVDDREERAVVGNCGGQHLQCAAGRRARADQRLLRPELRGGGQEAVKPASGGAPRGNGSLPRRRDWPATRRHRGTAGRAAREGVCIALFTGSTLPFARLLMARGPCEPGAPHRGGFDGALNGAGVLSPR